MAEVAFVKNDLKLATEIEPLEQVVDDLKDKIKHNHIIRLQKSECTIEHGFILADILNNLERVADHCSNIASCVIEISTYDALDMHKYLSELRSGNESYNEKYAEYSKKYAI
jgi:phosphate:Na+ symporter